MALSTAAGMQDGPRRAAPVGQPGGLFLVEPVGVWVFPAAHRASALRGGTRGPGNLPQQSCSFEPPLRTRHLAGCFSWILSPCAQESRTRQLRKPRQREGKERGRLEPGSLSSAARGATPSCVQALGRLSGAVNTAVPAGSPLAIGLQQVGAPSHRGAETQNEGVLRGFG